MTGSPDIAAPQRAPSDGKGEIVLSVDAMGGDKGPEAVVGGLDLFYKSHPEARVRLFGREEVLRPLVADRYWAPRVTIHHADGVVTMHDKPSQVMRHGRDTSMWAALQAVRSGEAAICVSGGNTGALMATAMLILRKAEGVNRPAITCLWPSVNPGGFNLLLDAGADIRADQDDLLAYALMGAAFARIGLGLEHPRIGLLNVGSEEHKGRAEIKVAHDLITQAASRSDFDYKGFIEGGDIPSSKIDVIVTDGFTGNVALKTAEGTSTLVTNLLKDAFKSTLLSKIGAMLAMGAIKKMAKKVDPRSVNGGVFLGLNGTVIKSHGGADSTGIAAALELAHKLAAAGFTERLAAEVSSALSQAQDHNQALDRARLGGAAVETDIE